MIWAQIYGAHNVENTIENMEEKWSCWFTVCV